MENGVYKRTFEAAKHPKGSAERAELNLSGFTSEYSPSYKYRALYNVPKNDVCTGLANTRDFLRKSDATEWLNAQPAHWERVFETNRKHKEEAKSLAF